MFTTLFLSTLCNPVSHKQLVLKRTSSTSTSKKMPSECITSKRIVNTPCYGVTVESRPLTPEHKENEIDDITTTKLSSTLIIHNGEGRLAYNSAKADVTNWTLFFEDFVTEFQQSIPNSLYNRWVQRLKEAGFGEFMVLARCARDLWDECQEQMNVKFDQHTQLLTTKINLLQDNLTSAPEYGIEINITIKSTDLNRIAFIPYCQILRPLTYFNSAS